MVALIRAFISSAVNSVNLYVNLYFHHDENDHQALVV